MTSRKRNALFFVLLAAPVLLLAAAFLVNSFGSARASSHREAPMIAKDQYADNTDTYVWIPTDQTENIVLAASWIPFEGAEGGPNYYEWDPAAVYYIYVDNDGDAAPDFTYELTSRVAVGDDSTFLYSTGPINSINDATWNRKQYITVTEIAENGSRTVLVNDRLTAPVNIGSKSTPNWNALRDEAIYTVNTGGDTVKVYAGQTDDPFFVDLQVFDLLTLRGQNPPVGYSSGNNVPVDSLSGYNVHSLVIELPIDRLTQGSETVLGVWSTTDRPSMNVLGEGEGAGASQISRLGMPLVNELVLPYALKDVFNSIPPTADLTVYGQLQPFVEDPLVGQLLCGLYGVPLPEDSNDDCSTEFDTAAPGSGRGDIFQIFVTGMTLANDFTIQTAGGPVVLPAGTNVNTPANVRPAEMIRINTALSGATCHPDGPQVLGLLAGDACGFPNGRHPANDVTDIELLAVAGAAYSALDGEEAGFAFNPALIQVLSDNVDANDVLFTSTFPYLPAAQSGQEHCHENPSQMDCGGTTALSIAGFTTEVPTANIALFAAIGLITTISLSYLFRRTA